MPAWLTIYCSRSIAGVSAADIVNGVNYGDLFTIAEGFGIDDEEVVRQARKQLKIELVDNPDGLRFTMQYGLPDKRPVQIHIWSSAERINTEREEALELLGKFATSGHQRVRSHLDRVNGIVAIELGWSQLDDMGIVLAGQAAEYFARAGNGLIRDQNSDWWADEDHVPVLLIGPKHRPRTSADDRAKARAKDPASPADELKKMLEDIVERALDNMEKSGFHLPVCLGHTPTGESVYFLANNSKGGNIDFQACKESVEHQTKLWISERKLCAVAFATVVHVKIADEAGAISEVQAVKILLDHADQKGYAAYLPFSVAEGKATPGTINYMDLPERFFSLPRNP